MVSLLSLKNWAFTRRLSLTNCSISCPASINRSSSKFKLGKASAGESVPKLPVLQCSFRTCQLCPANDHDAAVHLSTQKYKELWNVIEARLTKRNAEAVPCATRRDRQSDRGAKRV